MIQVENLTKAYGRTEAIRELTFQVERGSIYGLIGANGAGKTTTLSILAGLMTPTSGSATILGLPVAADSRKLADRIGFSSPQLSGFDYLTGREILLACGLLHHLPAADAERRADDLLDVLDLQSAAGHYVYEYSQGMRQKLGLACALIHAPDVLLLDEPFDSLDPTSVYRLVALLRKMAAQGKTILLTSHDLALVQRLCDRVGILHEGNIKQEIATGDLQQAEETRGSLESLLWQVVGSPDLKNLSWI